MKKRRLSKKQKVLVTAALVDLVIPFSVLASTVSAEIPYQTFLDFAKNRGQFTPGSQDIYIYDKSDNIVGVLNAPMPDFSSADLSAVSTLISPQYLAGVKHNGGYTRVSFGYSTDSYNLIDRNNDPSIDFHAPRLNKLVTEVTPAETAFLGNPKDANKNKARYTAFYRVGSGTQNIKQRSGHVDGITGAYSYLTGGTVGSPSYYPNFLVVHPGYTFNPIYGPLASMSMSGDSGSPLFAYDSYEKKWVLAATLDLGDAYALTNWALTMPPDFIKKTIDEDTLPDIISHTSATPIIWSFDSKTGMGKLSQQAAFSTDAQGQVGTDLNKGKNLVFAGANNSTINITNDVKQGGGSLTFKNNYTVDTPNQSTWTGAGVDIQDNATVTWKVNGVAGDNLHKIGKGTLIVNGNGVNEGGLKVGDGVVVLNQQADSTGKVQAFSHVNIASGRPTLVLSNSQQVDPDNISWGFRGGVLDTHGNNITFHRLNAADYGAIITNLAKDVSTLTLNPDQSKGEAVKESNYLFHGQLNGNMLVNSISTLDKPMHFIMDGSTDNLNAFVQENGKLTLQGHPVIHATVAESIAHKIYSLDGDTVKTAPVSFDQPDWEERTFQIKTLSLINTDFALARNAMLIGDIKASHATLTMGSPSVFIDSNDGTGKPVAPVAGQSPASTLTDISTYQGNVSLADNSALTVNNEFSGSINATNSKVNVLSTQATLSGYSQFNHTDLTLGDKAVFAAKGGWFSDSPVTLGKNATLLLDAAPTSNRRLFTPAFYDTSYGQGFTLNTGSQLSMGALTYTSGDITANGAASVIIGSPDPRHMASNLSIDDQQVAYMLGGFTSVYAGRINAPLSSVDMVNAQWQLPGDAHVKTLSMQHSLTSFTGRQFHTLTLDTLQANNAAFALKTDLTHSDKLIVKQHASGQNNTLFVNFLKKPGSNDKSLNIPLVSAPHGTDPAMFKAANRVIGFSLVTPTIHTAEQDGQVHWILDGYHAAADKGTVNSANSFMAMGYKNFITEVNNLNKRMGDLRDTPSADGLWARLMNGAGTGNDGYSDRFTHLQMGVDKKHRFAGADVFTGVLMSYTKSTAQGTAYHGSTNALGGGLYASLLFDSGFYVDAIGKYIHNDNDYNAGFASLGERHYSTHAWYAGLEGGYRYHLTDSLYIEPQAELVYGAVSGTTLKWDDSGMNVSMRNKTYNPLIGRTGVALGKTFTGKGWSVTTRAGVDWQFDVISNGETVLRDASGEKRFTGEKDGRMLYNLGINAKVQDNTRFGLELERSAFGKYNVDHVINVNFRYMF
ncbi:S6 family peptidase (plasmid) [Edwardsiella tarda]|uniref:S6 family peptidase n=1 Tax=Edwardsiella tarda TaxID=636 RepID=UPI002444794D|nr:S6 family peptidase [Edwardsiella tarda]WGE30887.1 S6 family peptidase [Edwardsiella tarda]